MLDRIKINYTYYNNPELLQQVIDHYEPYKAYFTFAVIDDGSQEHPLTKDMLPSYWKGYRITEDLGWGNEVARNILMRKTDSIWNALLDLDIVLDLSDPASLQFLAPTSTDTSLFVKYYDRLRLAKLIFQFPFGGRTAYDDYTKVLTGKDADFAINSFIVSSQAWQKTYGYDMVFAWTYGMDCTLIAQWEEVGMPNGALKKIATQACPSDWRVKDNSTEIYDAFSTIRDLHTGGGRLSQNFVWRDERERLHNSKSFPEVVDI